MVVTVDTRARYAVSREVSPWLARFDAELQPGLRVLEVGCGLGHDADELAAYEASVVGLDCEPGRVGRARRQAPGARLLVADIRQALPFRDDAFDLAVASLSLHYFDRGTTGRIVAELARVLRPHGTLICRVNARGDILHGYGRGTELEPDFFEVRPGHTKRYFSPQLLAECLRPAFTVQQLTPRLAWTDTGEKRTLECLARRAG